MENLKKIIVDSSSGSSYEIPLTTAEIAQLDRDRKEAEEFFNKVQSSKKNIDEIKNKLLSGNSITSEEFKILFGE